LTIKASGPRLIRWPLAPALAAACVLGTSAVLAAYADQGEKYWTEYAKIADDPAMKKLSANIEKTIEEPARNARSSGNLDESVALWEKDLSEWKKLPDSVFRTTKMRVALDNCVGIYRTQNKYDKVEQGYRQMSELYHDYHTAGLSQSISEAMLKQKKYKEAQDFLQTLIAKDLDCRYPADRISLANAYEANNELSLAEKTLIDLERSALLAHQPLPVRSARVAHLDFLKRHGRQADAAVVQKSLADKHCPVCGSDSHVQRIAYGLIRGPLPNAHRGGCMISPDSPQWYCQKDKLEF